MSLINLAFSQNLSTNVECAGQCLTYGSCTAFHYLASTKTCRVLKSPYLYRDKTDGDKKDVYMQVSKWNLRGKI